MFSSLSKILFGGSILVQGALSLEVFKEIDDFRSDMMDYLTKRSTNGDLGACSTVVNKYVNPSTEISVWGKTLIGEEAFLEMCLKLRRSIDFSSITSEAVFTNIPLGVAAVRAEIDGTCYNSGTRFQGLEMVSGIEWSLLHNKLQKLVLLFPSPEEWASACSTLAVKNSYSLYSSFFRNGFSDQTMDMISDDAVFRSPNFIFFMEDGNAPDMEFRGRQGFRNLASTLNQLFDYKTAVKNERKTLYQDETTVVSEMSFTIMAKLTGKNITRVAYSTHRFNSAGQLIFCECLLDQPMWFWDIFPPTWTQQVQQQQQGQGTQMGMGSFLQNLQWKTQAGAGRLNTREMPNLPQGMAQQTSHMPRNL